MIIPVRCFTCGKIISESYEQYKVRKQAYDKAIEAGEKPKETPKQILDDLGIDRYCCRRMILSHVDLMKDVSPYE
jgi:DNA-directed RNA polymerase subunit N